nr:MAG TPA: hypothetical protein [Caudoviricetes sp.]
MVGWLFLFYKILTDPKSLNYGGTADATCDKKARC